MAVATLATTNANVLLPRISIALSICEGAISLLRRCTRSHVPQVDFSDMAFLIN